MQQVKITASFAVKGQLTEEDQDILLCVSRTPRLLVAFRGCPFGQIVHLSLNKLAILLLDLVVFQPTNLDALSRKESMTTMRRGDSRITVFFQTAAATY